MHSPASSPVNEARIRWQLRRGMKELDVLCTRYYERRYGQASEAQREAFRSLLVDVEDPDIWAWAMGYEPAPERYAQLIAEMTAPIDHVGNRESSPP